MDLEKLKGTPQLDAAFSFKIGSEDKKEFVDECLKHNLSSGKVIRALIKQFVDDMKIQTSK